MRVGAGPHRVADPDPHGAVPQRFTSKQDVIRHYNMHKKRDNSLQHGFMRFSPLDDCSVYYHGCHLNGKSTHYHCMQVPTHGGPGGAGGGPDGGGATPVALIGAGEIQGAVYTDQHFSGFNTKSRIANGSRGGFCLILCFNATQSLGFFKVSGPGGAAGGCT